MRSPANVLTDWSRLTDQLSRLAARVQPWHVLLVALSTMAFLPYAAKPFFVLLVFLLCMALAWFREFAFLMRLRDEDFPGRYDKPIWALLLILLPPVGALVFWSFRQAKWPEAKPVEDGTARDLC